MHEQLIGADRDKGWQDHCHRMGAVEIFTPGPWTLLSQYFLEDEWISYLQNQTLAVQFPYSFLTKSLLFPF